MKVLVLLRLEFEGEMHEPDDIIELPANASADLKAELSARARQGAVRVLADDPSRDVREMQPAPAARGYRKRA